MLYSIDSQQYITTIPHKKEFDIWRGRLSEQEYDSICEKLNFRISENEINTSSWIPGSDWTDTVYEPIYVKACNQHQEMAAKCFGLILWVVLMNHPDVWAFGRYEKEGVPIEGMTYFRLTKPPR